MLIVLTEQQINVFWQSAFVTFSKSNAKVLLTFRKLISEAPLRQPFLILHEAVKVSAKTSQGSDDNSGHKHPLIRHYCLRKMRSRTAYRRTK